MTHSPGNPPSSSDTLRGAGSRALCEQAAATGAQPTVDLAFQSA